METKINDLNEKIVDLSITLEEKTTEGSSMKSKLIRTQKEAEALSDDLKKAKEELEKASGEVSELKKVVDASKNSQSNHSD
mmetsp:Transcript_31437/g.48075  ORF Transcript_31437/g.48075 Transcript_31437/m.48075 type:complete len:81 (-) Transcript_31437:5350-5592(-)